MCILVEMNTLELVKASGKQKVTELFGNTYSFNGILSDLLLSPYQRECFSERELSGLEELLSSEVGWTVGALITITQTTRSPKESIGRVSLRLLKDPNNGSQTVSKDRANYLLPLNTLSFPQNANIYEPIISVSPLPGRLRKR